MHTIQASLQFEVVRLGEFEPLPNAARMVEYMTGAFAEHPETESLWVVCLAPKRRPIMRVCLKSGPLAASMVSAREIMEPAILTHAQAIAVVRGEPGSQVKPNVHDLNALKRWSEAAKALGIEFVDYVIVGETDESAEDGWHSCREAREL